jgi:hypothetical protein
MMEVRDGVALVENGHGISCAGIDSASGRTLWRAEGALLANEDALLVRGEASTRLLDRRTGSELRTLDPSVLWVGHGYRLERGPRTHWLIREADASRHAVGFGTVVGFGAAGPWVSAIDGRLSLFRLDTEEFDTTACLLPWNRVWGEQVVDFNPLRVLESGRWVRLRGPVLSPDANWSGHRLRGGLVMDPTRRYGSALQPIVIWTDIFDRALPGA